MNSTLYVAIYSILLCNEPMHIGCEISFNKNWRSPNPLMEFSLYYPSTEELETVISNLATRDELRRQQLCSVPKKYDLFGLRSESGFSFWQKDPKMVWFWPKWYRFLLEIFRPFCQKISLLDQSQRKSNHLRTLHYWLLQNAPEIWIKECSQIKAKY